MFHGRVWYRTDSFDDLQFREESQRGRDSNDGEIADTSNVRVFSEAR